MAVHCQTAWPIAKILLLLLLLPKQRVQFRNPETAFSNIVAVRVLLSCYAIGVDIFFLILSNSADFGIFYEFAL